MRFAAVGGPSQVSVRESPDPVPGPGDLVVRMVACGICGSDVEKVYGRYGQPSVRLGHEPAGVVKAVGEGVEDFGPGDRVFTHHHVPCYSCYLCRHGNETACPEYYGSNLAPCGLAQEYLVPAWNVKHGGVLRLPDSMSFEEAAMIEPLACCIRAWSKCGYRRGDSVAIFGTGSTGMMHAMLAAHHGFSGVCCVDTNEFRLAFAEKLGVSRTILAGDGAAAQIRDSTDGRGADLAIVATGSMSALQSAIASVRRGGTVMMFGVPSKGAALSLEMDDMYSREISLLSSYAASDADTAEALRLIRDGKVDAGRLVTHKYDISESQQAFDRAKSGQEAVKIIITGG